MSLVKHPLVLDGTYIRCSNTRAELRARTTLCVHFDEGVLQYLPMEKGNWKGTLVFPSYLHEGINRGMSEKLLEMDDLSENEGILYGLDQGKYESQPSLLLLPCDILTTQHILKTWLQSQRLFLQDRQNLKDTIVGGIRDKMTLGKASDNGKKVQEEVS